VADINQQLAADFATANGTKAVDVAELLKTKLDLVTIAVPNANHYAVSKDALAAGHAILCEKPLTRSAEQSRELTQRVAKSGKPFFVGYMKRSHPTMRKFAEFAKQIGTPRSGLVRVYHPFPTTAWQNVARGVADKPGQPRDGALTNAGSHQLDLLLQAAGPVKKVLGARLQYRPGCPFVDTAAHALVEMQSGATITIECGWLPLSGVGFRENGWDEVLELRGDDGLARLFTTWWDRPDTEAPIADLWQETTRTRESFNAGAVDWWTSQYQMLAQALAGETTPLCTAAEATAVDELIDEIHAVANQPR
jgi:predicted dehydrogenase